MGKMRPYKIDKKIFSTSAGAFSPSKINIIIGTVCLIIWSIIAIMHFIFLFFHPLSNMQIVVLGLIFIVILIIGECGKIYSPYLSEYIE